MNVLSVQREMLIATLIAIAAGATPCCADDVSQARDAYLQKCESGYSDEHHMLGLPFQSPGYHSQVPQGTWAHPTRRSLAYAVALVERGEAKDLERAEKVIRKVLTLQVTDPKHPYYGIWPWLLEEPVDEMAPPDRNWADFLGAQIAVLLKNYPDRLPGDLRESMRASLRHAVIEIRRRDVQPSYTNIAIMGGGVCAAAGELFDDEEMLAYGRDRLQRCVAATEHHGGFNEYNSPTYTIVALHEAERVLQVVDDALSREAAEQLRLAAWQVVADSFHPATGQWAGPHSRAYYDVLPKSLVEFLEAQTGAKITVEGQPNAWLPMYDMVRHLPCPENLQARFVRLPNDPLEIRRSFIRKENDADSVRGVTWHTTDACLGSVNRSMLWTQRRTLLGYWTTSAEPVVVFRQRFLHDGEDFASMGVRNEQKGPHVLSLFEPLRNRGSWHPSLDRPKDGVFQAKDFRVRYQLAGSGASVRKLNQQTFELAAGKRRVVVHVLPGQFDGRDVRWECGGEEGVAWVDGMCYQGEPKDFDFKTFDDVKLAVAAELLDRDAAESVAPEWSEDAVATWNVGESTLRVSR